MRGRGGGGGLLSKHRHHLQLPQTHSPLLSASKSSVLSVSSPEEVEEVLSSVQSLELASMTQVSEDDGERTSDTGWPGVPTEAFTT